MNVLILHLNSLGKTFQLGLAYIASILRDKKHAVYFLSLSYLDKISIEDEMKNDIQLILISVTTDSFELCKNIVNFLNSKSNVSIIIGGIHPTIRPEECIALDGIMGICIGEGEYPLVELAEALEQKKDYTKINNLWVKREGKIYKNELRDLIQDLDSLPLPDYSIFKKYFDFEWLPIILSRGCPYNCSYCCNHSLRLLFKGKGRYLRHHSVPYSIKVVEQLIKQFPKVETIEFFDDTFTINIKWLHEFLKEFSKFKVKFVCNTRFDLMNEDMIKLLSGSGCVRINAGVECGNEKLRKEVLRRQTISDKQIIDGAKLLKKYNIRLYRHNMVGLPYETEEDILKTIELNKKIQVEEAQVSIFNPYPATYLGKICEDNNWINKKLKATSYNDFTLLETPFIPPHLVNYYFLVFPSMVFDSGVHLQVKKAIFWLLHFFNNKPYIFLRNAKVNLLLKTGTRRKRFLKKLGSITRKIA